MYHSIIRPILFLFPPEQAHQITMKLLGIMLIIPGMRSLMRKIYSVQHNKLKRQLWGLDFPNPVGLAAGFDKDAKHISKLACLGFGFIEIGTVTPLPQPGNDKPRLFRSKPDQALINRMGFNNDGVQNVIEHLKNRPHNLIVGGNIGKNKVTPNEDAILDYEKGFKALFPYVDYFVVNVSSPNTPNLRELQEKEPLRKILGRLKQLGQEMRTDKQRPILLKIAPDLSNDQLDDVIEVIQQTAIDGIVATNTTISRENISVGEEVQGGVSGKPLTQRSTEVIRYLAQKIDIPIIGVGGIFSAKDALEKIQAGASLVQLYTGFIYEGPSLIGDINKALTSFSGKN